MVANPDPAVMPLAARIWREYTPSIPTDLLSLYAASDILSSASGKPRSLAASRSKSCGGFESFSGIHEGLRMVLTFEGG